MSDSFFYLILAAAAIVIACGLIVFAAQFLNDFTRELRYLKGEIQRNTGAERRHWIRRRRRLWLSLLPFIRY